MRFLYKIDRPFHLVKAKAPLGVLLGILALSVSAGVASGNNVPQVHANNPEKKVAVLRKPTYPSMARIMNARWWLEQRSGRTAFAVVDSRGKLHGWNLYERFHSASLIKAMLLVAYLRQLGPNHQLSSYDRGLLYPMIHESDNGAATAVDNIVGDDDLERVARAAHMRSFTPGGGFWGLSEITAADQARFFYDQDSYIPLRFDGYARYLLSHIESDQRWGIPAGAAGTPFAVFFKGGWLPDEGLENQAARLERPGYTFAMSVLSTGDPSSKYGEETEEGVMARLLGRDGR